MIEFEKGQAVEVKTPFHDGYRWLEAVVEYADSKIVVIRDELKRRRYVPIADKAVREKTQ